MQRWKKKKYKYKMQTRNSWLFLMCQSYLRDMEEEEEEKTLMRKRASAPGW